MADLACVCQVLGGSAEGAVLCDALPHAVAPCPAGETRHEFQEKVIDCVRRALADAHDAAQAQAAASRASIEAARVQEAEAKAAAARAGEAAGVAGADVKAKAEALDVAKATVREEEALHSSTEAETQQAMQDHKEHETRKSDIEALLTLVDGAAALGADASESIAEFLTAQRAEKPLVVAVPSAFGLAPDARSQFDNLVVDSAKKVLQDSLAEAQVAVDAGTQAARNAEAELLGAWAVLDCARDRASAADTALSAAKAALVEAQSAQKAEEAGVATATERLQTALAEHVLAESKPSDITTAQQAFERLVQGEAAPEATTPVAAQTAAPPVAEKTHADLSTAPVPMDCGSAATAGA
mmetsp:Transcript_56201/g.171172  ORF Transcript_56201/g.171172 Transcript_56201/m.171172 type:complete len:356 (-) Transcript_56201:231-1298(-)